jgi:hypothetical protein
MRHWRPTFSAGQEGVGFYCFCLEGGVECPSNTPMNFVLSDIEGG